MSETRMRFRTDSCHAAEDSARLARGEKLLYHRSPSKAKRTPPAEPGDVWVIHWHSSSAKDRQGPIAGYAICCPKCLRVHRWTSALGCGGGNCPHQGKSSCWTWTGSAEDGTLSASPSLHCVTSWNGKGTGGCGWHGWLTNGVLRE